MDDRNQSPNVELDDDTYSESSSECSWSGPASKSPSVAASKSPSAIAPKSKSLSTVSSQSSTYTYSQEPFTTYGPRVLEFATKSLWPGSTPGAITIERLKGGGYNRIIGITRSLPDTSEQARYVLRIPRFMFSQVARDVAALLFVRTHTAIPSPDVVSFDDTPQNILGSPYALHRHIPGTDLYDSFTGLNHPSRCRLARELGAVVNQMLAVRSDTAGRLILPRGQKSLQGPIYVLPLGSIDDTTIKPYANASIPMPIYGMLVDIFQARIDKERARNPNDIIISRLWHRCCRMARQLRSGGWFRDGHYSLAHLDFAPRNILINPDSPQGPVISGILDWDSAVLAPWFMCCAPPMWLWSWQDDEDEDERKANEEPSTVENAEIKRLFEESAGKDYVRLAYDPAYRLGRQLVLLAVNDIRSSDDWDSAEAMLKEWKVFWKRHRECNVARDAAGSS